MNTNDDDPRYEEKKFLGLHVLVVVASNMVWEQASTRQVSIDLKVTSEHGDSQDTILRRFVILNRPDPSTATSQKIYQFVRRLKMFLSYLRRIRVTNCDLIGSDVILLLLNLMGISSIIDSFFSSRILGEVLSASPYEIWIHSYV